MDQRGELANRVVEILKSHGIRMSVYACGCCEGPLVNFEYNGDLIIGKEDEEYMNFNMFDGDLDDKDFEG